jgi:hypothetical protein
MTRKTLDMKLSAIQSLLRQGRKNEVRQRPPKLSFGQRMLEFTKEWGGVATVAIAILYTFPFGIIDRIVNGQEHRLQMAREALSQFAALQVDRIATTSRISEPQARDFVNNMYQVRIYNIINQNKDLFREEANKLIFSEAYAIGSA